MVIRFLCIVTSIAQLGVFPAANGQTSALAVSPDRTMLAIGTATGSISLLRLSNGAAIGTMEGRRLPIRDLGFSAESDKLIALEGDHTLEMYAVGEKSPKRLIVDYRYSDSSGGFAATMASDLSNEQKIVLGRALYAAAYVVDGSSLWNENAMLVLSPVQSHELGAAGFSVSGVAGDASASVKGELQYGSNPGDDSWTDFASCPSSDVVAGTTKAGYLLTWNISKFSSSLKVGNFPYLDPERQQRVAGGQATGASATSVSCSRNGMLATLDHGSDGKVQIKVNDFNGELVSRSNTAITEPALEEASRIVWDTSGKFLMTASHDGYVAYAMQGADIHALFKVRLLQKLGLATGRPIAGYSDGMFLIASGDGAWAVDASSGRFTKHFGSSDSPPLIVRPDESLSVDQTLPSYTDFFQAVMKGILRPQAFESVKHPLFKTTTNYEFELPNLKRNANFTFSCDVGGRYKDFADERKECVNSLSSRWEEFLRDRGYQSSSIRDYGEPGWARRLVSVRKQGREIFEYLFEAEGNEIGASGYSEVSILLPKRQTR
jgi:hypothetical protein